MAKTMKKTNRGTEVRDTDTGEAWLWPTSVECRECEAAVATVNGKVGPHRGRKVLCRGSGAFVGRRIEAPRAA